MGDLIMKIFFTVAVIPVLIVIEGYKKLKSMLARHGIHIDGFDVYLVLLILLLIILLLNGYRW